MALFIDEKKWLNVIVIFIVMNFSVENVSGDNRINKIYQCIQEGKYDEAVARASDFEGGDEAAGYRSVAFIMLRNRSFGVDVDTVKKFYRKGCENIYAPSCVEYGVLLERDGKYNDAEDLYLKIDKIHKDVKTAELLSDLYKKNEWSGYSIDDSNKWLQIYIERMEKKKGKK